MSEYWSQPYENIATSEDHHVDNRSSIHPECAPVSGSEDKIIHHSYHDVHKGSPERNNFHEYHDPSNVGHHKHSKLSNFHIHPNSFILTHEGDTFSENHIPSSVYIGISDSDKVIEYRATTTVYKIIPQIKFEDLTISEKSSVVENIQSSEKDVVSIKKLNSKQIEINNEYPVHSFNTKPEEVDILPFNSSLPEEDTQEDKKEAKVEEFEFPPILCRKKEGSDEDKSTSQILCSAEFDDSKSTTSISSKYGCKCVENDLCSCRNMRGKFYEYYLQTKEKEYYAMYTQGRCILSKGTVLHFTGATSTMRRENISEALRILGAKVEFIDYQQGNKEGWARLSYAYEARIIIKKMTDNKLKICDAELIFTVLSGKKEKKYLENVIDAIYKLQEKSKGLGKLLKKSGYKYEKSEKLKQRK